MWWSQVDVFIQMRHAVQLRRWHWWDGLSMAWSWLLRREHRLDNWSVRDSYSHDSVMSPVNVPSFHSSETCFSLSPNSCYAATCLLQVKLVIHATAIWNITPTALRRTLFDVCIQMRHIKQLRGRSWRTRRLQQGLFNCVLKMKLQQCLFGCVLKMWTCSNVYSGCIAQQKWKVAAGLFSCFLKMWSCSKVYSGRIAQ